MPGATADLPDPELDRLARRLGALAADPAADRLGFGMATHTFAEMVDRAVRGGDPGWLQLLWHAAVESAAALPAADVARFEGRLRAAGVEGLGPAIAAYLGELRAVERRGIASEEERGLVQDRFARIRGTPGAGEEVGRLEAVLAAWFRRPGHGGPASGAPTV